MLLLEAYEVARAGAGNVRKIGIGCEVRLLLSAKVALSERVREPKVHGGCVESMTYLRPSPQYSLAFRVVLAVDVPIGARSGAEDAYSLIALT